MANHKSAEKRIRANETKHLQNKYHAKTMRNALRDLRDTKDKAKAAAMVPKVSSMLDKLSKTNVIHKSKAANLKSSIARLVNSL